MPHPTPRLHARLGALAFVAALSGVALSPLAAVAESKPAHSHDHAHDHAKDPAAAKIYAGHFDDDQIKARTLADWAGEWQSVHPLLERPIPAETAPAPYRRIPRAPLRPAPMPGEHTREICTRVLGLTPERIDGLLAAGVLFDYQEG